MSSSGMGLSSPASPQTPGPSPYQLQAEQVVKAGAGWFIWIAGLSVVNSLAGLFGTAFHFILGLGVTQVVDVLARRAGNAGVVLDLVINGCVVGVFVLFWHFARKEQRWAFIVGMIFYALDGLILLLFEDFFGAAFHAYALFMLYRGLSGISLLEQIRQASLPAGAAIEPQ
ncbi:MAG: hypothetical protein JST79_22545 [Acidobacteria bacterium]|nr:hypothetical protein [Acidobacteriota bacterium]